MRGSTGWIPVGRGAKSLAQADTQEPFNKVKRARLNSDKLSLSDSVCQYSYVCKKKNHITILKTFLDIFPAFKSTVTDLQFSLHVPQNVISKIFISPIYICSYTVNNYWYCTFNADGHHIYGRGFVWVWENNGDFKEWTPPILLQNAIFQPRYRFTTINVW